MKTIKGISGLMRAVFAVAAILTSQSGFAACKDSVVLVHGNASYSSDWDSTYDALINAGYSSSQIYRPSWGNKGCPACNNHNGWEETPVEDAIEDAIAASCTGKIDIIGHSMGNTLAAKQIIDLGVEDKVDAFVAIAGAWRGLWSCGTYPYNVQNSTCGYWGLSVSSPFLDWLYSKSFSDRLYSIKSWSDQIICSTGYCTVGGIHSSSVWGEDASYTYSYGHWGLQAYTSSLQLNLLD